MNIEPVGFARRHALKVAEDSLSGILYVDDHQTHEIVMNVGEPIPGGALVITVSALEVPQ